MAMLVSRGTAVTGSIVLAERRRRSRTHKACIVRYAFTTTGGMPFEREIEVMPTEFDKFSEGDTEEIVYDPSDPENNVLKSVVDAVKAASKQRSMGT